MRLAGWLGMVALLGAAPGCGSLVFSCSDDSGCGGEGRCEADGWCSFPDASCPSGRRYAEFSGDGAGGSCLDTAAGMSSTGGVDSGPGGSNSGPSATSPTLETSADGSSGTGGTTQDTATTEPIDTDGSDGSDTMGTISVGSTTCPNGDCASTGGTTDASSSSEDTGDPPGGCPGFLDEFDDGAFDPAWQPYGDGGPDAHVMQEVGGELHWDFAVGVVQQRGLTRTLDDPTSSIRVHATQTAQLEGQQAQSVVLFREDGNPPDLFLVWGNGRVQFRTGSEVVAESVVHEWVEVRFLESSVQVAVSSNGVDFQDIGSAPDSFGAGNQSLWVYGQTWTAAPAESSAAFGSIEVCTQ